MNSVIGSLLRQDRLRTDLQEGDCKVIDLRSDFVSRPTPEMIAAMIKAAQSTCSFGLREAPTKTFGTVYGEDLGRYQKWSCSH